MLHPYHKIKKRKIGDSSAIKAFNSFIIVFAVVAPFTTIPQIYLIYSTKTATGVSSVTWLTYTAGALIWFLYGLVHKEKVIIINSSIGFLLALCVFVGTIMYGG